MAALAECQRIAAHTSAVSQAVYKVLLELPASQLANYELFVQVLQPC